MEESTFKNIALSYDNFMPSHSVNRILEGFGEKHIHQLSLFTQ